MKLFATDVFTPNDFPEYTYVQRAGDDLETKLQRAWDTPKVVVSISGPSKSGKTVLVEKVVGKDDLILVSGAEVQSGDDLWSCILSWIEAPSTATKQTTASTGHRFGGETSGRAGIPVVAEAGAKGSYDHTRATSTTVTETRTADGIVRIAREIGNSTFVVFLDDFHYIPQGAQADVARQIKAAAERGIRICVATVPHHADDVVRSNHELRGRLAQVDTSFWTIQELAQIAIAGFSKLLVDITPQQATRLAEEACGSPQLMQRMFGCVLRSRVSTGAERKSCSRSGSRSAQSILEQSSTHADFGTMVANMHQGPKTRGTDRRMHQLIDGSEGDVYRVLLLALAHGNPTMSLPYTNVDGEDCGSLHR